MTQQDDNRIVDYLFDELSDEDAQAFERAMSEDAALSAEVDALDDALGAYRELEDEEPPPHLDALILATARQTAEAVTSEAEARSWGGRLRRWILSPAFGMTAAASLAVLVIVTVNASSFLKQEPAAEALPPGYRAPVAVTASPERGAEAPDEKVVAEETPADDLAFGDAEPEEDVATKSDRAPAAEPEIARGVFRETAKELPKAERKFAAPRPKPREPQILEEAVAPKATATPQPEPAKPARRRTRAAAASAAPAPSSPSAGGADGALGGVAAAPDEDREGLAIRDSMTLDEASAPAPPPPPVVEQRSLQKKARVRADSRSAPTSRAEAQAVAPTDVPAKDKEASRQGTSNERAAEIARAMLTAAQQAVARKEYDSARRIYARAVERVGKTVSEGDVLLEWAYFERDQERFEVAVRLADRASRVPGFARRAEAERFVEANARRIAPMSAPASAPPR